MFNMVMAVIICRNVRNVIANPALDLIFVDLHSTEMVPLDDAGDAWLSFRELATTSTQASLFPVERKKTEPDDLIDHGKDEDILVSSVSAHVALSPEYISH